MVTLPPGSVNRFTLSS